MEEFARMPLSAWIEKHLPKPEMYWKDTATSQFKFLAKLSTFLFPNEAKRERCAAVVGTHWSKSIELPVVEFQLENARIVMRDNFYDWKVSVQIDEPIDIDVIGSSFTELFDPKGEHSECYCEGFSEYDVFGSFDSDRRRFTVSIGNDDNLMKFCEMLYRYAAKLSVSSSC